LARRINGLSIADPNPDSRDPSAAAAVVLLFPVLLLLLLLLLLMLLLLMLLEEEGERTPVLFAAAAAAAAAVVLVMLAEEEEEEEGELAAKNVFAFSPVNVPFCATCTYVKQLVFGNYFGLILVIFIFLST